ncbi:hypothetical protein [uncultured Pseudomonas sp.]|uniref:hypothetical protein n=1 Tax=uncultured Pseudomonas sp. TaxID=114707 RepID=UPI002053DD38|nr:hypothetical protein [uncultured Pseudomonas sp.]DAM66963.1 MAG TPA: hypothetical protein [Caudoviricetes sp.]
MPTENQNADPATSLAAGHDLNQWRIVPVEPTETMVINGFESEPDECFSDEEVWEQYQGMSGCQQAAFRAKLCWAAMLAAAPAAPQAELNRALAERDSNPKPDPALCKFYDVADWPGLVRKLVGHVAQLQDSAKRNVKPWEDTFPPTLLPAHIERVNTANSAAQPKGEQLACMPVERCYDVRAKMIIAFNEARKTGGDLDDALDAAYKSALRFSPPPWRPSSPIVRQRATPSSTPSTWLSQRMTCWRNSRNTPWLYWSSMKAVTMAKVSCWRISTPPAATSGSHWWSCAAWFTSSASVPPNPDKSASALHPQSL